MKHEVEIATYAGLAGYKNGALLKAAMEAGFNILLTGDQTLQYEPDLAVQRIALILLPAIKWRIVEDTLSKIADAVDGVAQR